MNRILFVDDEPNLLRGLSNLLRKHRRRWDMVFAGGGEEALEALRAGAFDVVVSDMRMPGMDGAQLLQIVKDLYPRTIRIVLSGHTEREALFRAMPVAHQFLCKPCDADTLPNVIERACRLQALVADNELARAISAIDRLPSPPDAYWRITQAIASENASADEIAAIVETDPAASAKLLQLASSGFLDGEERPTSIREAVAHLGVDTVRSLVLSAHLHHVLDDAPVVSGFSYDTLQASACVTARVAARIAGDPSLAPACFMAGLLHDIGQLVLAAAFPAQFEQVLAELGAGGRSQCEVERSVLGFSHAEAGAHLLALWGLPNSIVEAVAYHHEPARVAHQGLEIVGCVHIANALVDECLRPMPGGGPGPDMDYLASRGLAKALPAWRAVAIEETSAWLARRAATAA